MKTTKILAILVLALWLMVCPAELAGAEPMGTGFTYQGRLVDDNSVANGLYDFQFKVFDNPDVNIGKQWGSTIYINAFNVIDGNFTVELDFGSGIFTGDARWLEIGVRPGGSTDSFTILSPLQEVKPTPNSIHATHALQADEADTLNGFDSSAFASVAHSHDGVYALIGHAHDGSDITTGTVADGLIADSIARDSEITWDNLVWIPAGFADKVDNIGTGDITAVLASTGLTGGGKTGDVTLGVKVPLGLSGSSSGPLISGTNTGTGYAGDFGQTGASNINGGLNVTTAAGQYGAKILNQGGYSGYSYGLGVTIEKDNSFAYGLRADATSTDSRAYGGHFAANTTDGSSGSALGITIGAYNTSATAGGSSYGIHLYSDCFSGLAYGIRSNAKVGSGSTSDLYGIYSVGEHLGASGTSYGMLSNVYGSDTGNSYGIYSYGRKWSSDTAGMAYGGYFIGDNDRTGGESYGLYTQATGLNGHRYGLYSDVTTSSGYYNNYGLYTKVANNDYYSYGLYADLDPGSSGTGVYVDLDTTTECISNQYGLRSNVNHQGTSGWVYGVRSLTYSSDIGNNYAGYFSANSSPGDTGPLYGIYAYCDGDTSGSKYAVYANGPSGGYDFYAGGPGTNYGYASSIRWKSDVRPIDEPLDKVMRLRGVYFNWDAEHGGEHDVGMIAEEVGEVLPEIVQYEENGIDASGMDYGQLTPLLVEAVKALKIQADERQKQLAEKDVEIAGLKNRLTKLENVVTKLDRMQKGGR